MVRSRTALILLAVGAVAALAAVSRSLPDAKPTPRSYVQAPPEPPLPPGAECRLGTALFQGGGHRVAFSPDGRSLYASGQSGAREIDRATGRVRHEFRAPDRSIGTQDYLITPDGRALLETEQSGFSSELGAPDTRLRVRDWPSGKLRHEFPLAGGDDLIVSAGGTVAALLGGSSRVWMFDLVAGRHVRMEVADGFVVGAAFRAGTSELLLVDGAGRARLRRWDFRPGGAVEVGSFPVPGLEHGCLLAVSPDGRWLATLARPPISFLPDGRPPPDRPDGRFQLWDLRTGTRIADPDLGTDTDTRLRFLDDRFLLTVGRRDGDLVVRWWEAGTGRPGRPWTAPGVRPAGVAVSPDSQVLAVADPTGFIHRFDVSTGVPFGRAESLDGAVTDVTFPEPGTVVTWSGRPHVWNATTGRPTVRPPGPEPRADGDPTGRTEVGMGPFGGGKTLVSRDSVSGHQLWERPVQPAGSVRVAGFSADGRLVYLIGRGDLVRLESRTGREVARWDLLAAGVIRAKGADSGWVWASPDGRHLVIQMYPADLTVLDAATGAVRHRLGRAAWGRPVFSPDGRLVAAVVTQDPATVRVWDLATGAVRQTVRTDHRAITALAFDPVGTRLVTGGADGTGLVWPVGE